MFNSQLDLLLGCLKEKLPNINNLSLEDFDDLED